MLSSCAVTLTASGALLLLLISAPGYLTQRGFPLDDAWIHAAYGRSLARSGILGFNDGEPATGETSPLWAGVVALPHLLTEDTPKVVVSIKIIGFVMHVATAVLMLLAFTNSTNERWFSAVGAASVAASPDLVAAAMSGMEVPLATLCLATLLWGLQQGRNGVVAFCAFVAPLIRPELVIVVLGLSLLGPGRGARWQSVVSGASGLCVGLAGLCALNWWVSGRPLPATFYAKVTSFPLLASQYTGFTALLDQFPVVGSQWLLALCLGVIVWRTARGRDRLRLPAATFVAGLLFCAVSFALIFPVDPPAFYHQRYVLPALPLLLVSTALLIGRLTSEFGPLTLRRPLGIALGIALLVPTIAHSSPRYRHLLNDARNIDDVQVEVGKGLADAPANCAVWAVDAGAVRYFGRPYVVDTMALNSWPLLGSSREAHSFLDRHPPCYLIVVPGWSHVRIGAVQGTRQYRPSSAYTVTSTKAMQSHVLVNCSPGTHGVFSNRRRIAYEFTCRDREDQLSAGSGRAGGQKQD